ncbi:serine/threonine protein phosphatase [Rhizobium leguminosarum bv. trifolii]|uniref:Serine/threonine protein phosphatase n=1 Tax=Rhizobium leguminosarum bv. trifolii TaxID=386 RepID=A0A3E1BHT0_RHILT|nr:phosphatase PAP2/dual specificity phosphatase family protein [Rhizobium leguminosarum]RFB91991.1 serine/threonine protein phosphatase [Rhizobium leguminosarum bv. trifolii]RFB92508.1 serine/threonine protein phosphatase [Rhizobium leguminosarum bv. trifolii]
MEKARSTFSRAAPVPKRAALWLMFLAPFFYLSYGGANWLASQRAHVPNVAFAWESAIPFLAWTIIPYWSINLFYALCLFINTTPRDVDRLARRYLTIQIVAVACFVAFPLEATFVRPATSGLPGFMFAVLGGFDKPFNQAPSLHVALLVVIWDHLRGRLPRRARLLWHFWCFLIGASVLTTWQHHVMDIPTGMLLGLFAAWLFPRDAGSPLAKFAMSGDPKSRRLGVYYLCGAVACLGLAALCTPLTAAALLLLWPAVALAIVAVGYFGAGPQIFQKRADGRATLASRWLLAPYRLGALINVWLWTRTMPASVVIADGVHLGRFPRRHEADRFATVIDMTGELQRPGGTLARWCSFPTLDLAALDKIQTFAAANHVEAARQRGPVLVCCALGFQRSACVIMRWLLISRRCENPAEALRLLERAGRRVHLPARSIHAAMEGLQ